MPADTVNSGATLADAVAAADARLDLASAHVAPAAAERRPHARDAERHVLFTIAASGYAVPDAFVAELDYLPQVTLVPRVPAWVRGVANLRGDVISVVDLRVFLGLDAHATARERILVVRLLDEPFSTALVVDAIDGIATIAPADVRPPAAPLDGRLAAFLAGVCVVHGRPTAVLDLTRLLRSPDIRQFDDGTEDSSCKAR